MQVPRKKSPRALGGIVGGQTNAAMANGGQGGAQTPHADTTSTGGATDTGGATTGFGRRIEAHEGDFLEVATIGRSHNEEKSWSDRL